MKDLFYSESEKLLFWVAGYTWDGNTSVLKEMIDSLTENANKFAKVANCQFEQVRTGYVDNSRRYKYMRVFYVETDNVPESAFRLTSTNGWTMWKWLQN